jgi:hypothetical protein
MPEKARSFRLSAAATSSSGPIVRRESPGYPLAIDKAKLSLASELKSHRALWQGSWRRPADIAKALGACPFLVGPDEADLRAFFRQARLVAIG